MRYDTARNSTLTRYRASTDLATKEAIECVMLNPKFARNIRGRLLAALRLLDAPLQAKLACDYAEHLVWICEQGFNGNPLFCDAIRATKCFLDGRATIEEVAQARLELYEALYELREPHSFLVQSAIDAAWVIELAIQVCCQRQLEALGAVARTRHQPRVKAVASEAWHVVAHYAGGEDWESDDPQLKAAARKRGQLASDAEVQWQLNRLTDSIGIERCKTSLTILSTVENTNFTTTT